MFSNTFGIAELEPTLMYFLTRWDKYQQPSLRIIGLYNHVCLHHSHLDWYFKTTLVKLQQRVEGLSNHFTGVYIHSITSKLDTIIILVHF